MESKLMVSTRFKFKEMNFRVTEVYLTRNELEHKFVTNLTVFNETKGFTIHIRGDDLPTEVELI